MKLQTDIEKKQKSLNVFLSMLKRRGLAAAVDRALLYGSTARGEATLDSDIDILLFSQNPRKISRLISDASFETMLQTGDRIEAFVYPAEEFRHPSSYFLVCALKEGRVLTL